MRRFGDRHQPLAITWSCSSVSAASTIGVLVQPGLTELQRGLAGQVQYAGLGDVVGDIRSVDPMAVDRREIDDRPATLLGHDPSDTLGEQEGRGQVDGDDLVPGLLGQGQQRRVVEDAGVVDEDVDAPPVVHSRGYDQVEVLHDRHVGGHADDNTSALLGLGAEFPNRPTRQWPTRPGTASARVSAV